MYIENYNDASVFCCGTCQTWNVHPVIVNSLQVLTQLACNTFKHNTIDPTEVYLRKQSVFYAVWRVETKTTSHIDNTYDLYSQY